MIISHNISSIFCESIVKKPIRSQQLKVKSHNIGRGIKKMRINIWFGMLNGLQNMMKDK